MKTSSVTSLCAVLLFVTVPDGLLAQTDDFNDGNDNGWTRYDPLGGVGAGPIASFSVVNGQYRIASATSPNPAAAGPARAASLRQDKVYSTFCVGIDIIGQPTGADPAVGILARIQPNPSLGTTDGYALTLITADNNIQITRVADEGVVEFPSAPAVVLSPPYDPSRSYRLVFVGNGDYFEGRIFDIANPTVPVAVTSVFDNTHASGTCGLVVFDNSTGGASTVAALFDNYRADNGTPPAVQIFLSEDKEVSLQWPGHALCHFLQHSPSLANGQWTAVTSGIFHLNGTFHYFLGVPVVPEGFYRLALNGTP